MHTLTSNDKQAEKARQDFEQFIKIAKLAQGMVKNIGKTVFVLGAGASASSGVPMSNELKEELVKGFEKEMNEIITQKGIASSVADATLEMVL